MGIKDVGIENLPNVYIDSIIVSQPDEIRIRCLIKDNKEDKSWRLRTAMQDLSIRVVVFHDIDGYEQFNEITLGLNSGDKSLHDYRVTDESTHYSRFALAGEFGPLQTSESMISDETFYFKSFVFRHSLGLPYIDTARNITAYAACFIDNLNFDNEIFNKFYGPMASEKIIIAGAANTTSGYFYNPETNEEYGGPVHEHNGVYMEGSYHTDRSHAVLRYVVEPNNKITVEN